MGKVVKNRLHLDVRVGTGLVRPCFPRSCDDAWDL